MERRTLPPRRRIDDGARAGGLAGALIGAGLAVLTTILWFVVAGALLGGVAGHLWESRPAQS
jgi:hypothetical protein